jgi:hypothetical protein
MLSGAFAVKKKGGRGSGEVQVRENVQEVLEAAPLS